uniref:Retrotransposon gag domain-containing protein n=1 Tax=Strigamia maritima TaxID=126957 RepID=T1IZQ1_STRMM
MSTENNIQPAIDLDGNHTLDLNIANNQMNDSSQWTDESHISNTTGNGRVYVDIADANWRQICRQLNIAETRFASKQDFLACLSDLLANHREQLEASKSIERRLLKERLQQNRLESEAREKDLLEQLQIAKDIIRSAEILFPDQVAQPIATIGSNQRASTPIQQPIAPNNPAGPTITYPLINLGNNVQTRIIPVVDSVQGNIGNSPNPQNTINNPVITNGNCASLNLSISSSPRNHNDPNGQIGNSPISQPNPNLQTNTTSGNSNSQHYLQGNFPSQVPTGNQQNLQSGNNFQILNGGSGGNGNFQTNNGPYGNNNFQNRSGINNPPTNGNNNSGNRNYFYNINGGNNIPNANKFSNFNGNNTQNGNNFHNTNGNIPFSPEQLKFFQDNFGNNFNSGHTSPRTSDASTANILKNMSYKANVIKFFSGRGTDDDLFGFLEAVKGAALAINDTLDGALKKCVPLHLTDVAALWYRDNLPQMNTWEKFESLFKSRYALSETQMGDKLRATRPKHSETTFKYVERFYGLWCRQTHYNEFGAAGLLWSMSTNT